MRGQRRGGPYLYLCASSFCVHRDQCRFILLASEGQPRAGFTKDRCLSFCCPRGSPPRQGQRGCRKMGWLAAPAHDIVGRHWTVEALKSKIAYRNRFHRAFNRAERAFADNHLPWLRLAAQPGSQIGDATDGRVFAPMLETNLSEGRVT